MTLENKLRRHILENFLFTEEQDALANSDSFLDKGIVDSTGIMEVILFIEQEFDVVVADQEMIPDNLDSIDNLAAFINRKRSA